MPGGAAKRFTETPLPTLKNYLVVSSRTAVGKGHGKQSENSQRPRVLARKWVGIQSTLRYTSLGSRALGRTSLAPFRPQGIDLERQVSHERTPETRGPR